MSSLPEPSEEQLVIINDVQLGKNIVVNSVAGSGKTTLQLHIAKKYQDKKILLLTYSRKLKDETDVRNESKNLDIYTIHGYYSRLLSRSVNNDQKLKEIVEQGNIFVTSYDIIMIDEIQDLTPLLYQAIQSVIGNSQLVLVGDDRQCIYSYKQASSKYLRTPELYFGNRDWIYRSMIYSYRLPPLSGEFINHLLAKSISSDLGVVKGSEHQIRFIGTNLSSKNDKPIYIGNAWNNKNLIIKFIEKEIEHIGIDEVCILNNTISLESKSGKSNPMMEIYNGLASRGIPIYRRDKEDSNYDVSEEKGKLLVSTIHAMKGREKRVVFSLLDDYYASIPDRNETDLKVSYDNKFNLVYVSYTRHRDQLYIVSANKPFRPLMSEDILKYCTVVGRLNDIPDKFKPLKTEYITSVSNLVEYRGVEDTENMKKQLKLIERYKMEPINLSGCQYIPFKNDGKTLVSKYYGILVTIYAEYIITGKFKSIKTTLSQYITKYCDKYKIEGFEYVNLSISDLQDFFEENKPKKGAGIEVEIENKIYENYPGIVRQGEMLIKLYLYLILYLNWPYEYIYIDDFNWVKYDVIASLANKLKDLTEGKNVLFETPSNKICDHPHLKYLNPPEKMMYDAESFLTFKLPVLPEKSKSWLSKFGEFDKDEFKLGNLSILECTSINILARTDMIVNDEIWEIKIGNMEKDEDILQLGLYLSISDKNRGRLLNLNTGEVKLYEILDKEKYISYVLNKFAVFRDL